MRPLNDSERPLGTLLREAVTAARQRNDSRARALLTLAAERDLSGRAQLMFIRFCWRRGLLSEARQAAVELHALAQRRDCRQLQSASASALAAISHGLHDPLAASRWQQRSQSLDDENLQLGCDLTSRGNDALKAGDLELARTLFRSALAWEERRGSVAGQAEDWGSLGLVSLLEGTPGQAESFFRRALRLHRQVRSAHGIAQDCLHLGLAAGARRRWSRAERCFAAALKFARRANHAPLQQTIRLARRELRTRQRVLSTDPHQN